MGKAKDNRGIAEGRQGGGWLSAAGIGAVVLAMSLLGIVTRPIGLLAAFWPANAVLLGLFVRRPDWATLPSWSCAAAGYLAADILTGGGLVSTLWLTGANLVDVGVAVVLFRRLGDEDRRLQWPLSSIIMFEICVLAAAAAALAGAGAAAILAERQFAASFTLWFVTELVNAMVVLPVILTVPGWPRIRSWLQSILVPDGLLRRACPLAAVAVSTGLVIALGAPRSAGSLVLTVPALLWCAATYSLFATALITLMHSALMLMGATGGLNVLSGPPDHVESVLLIRLGIAMVALCPLVVASMRDVLATAESRWRFALEGSRQGIWDHDFERDRTYFSPQWKRALGYPADAAWDRISEWTSRLHPDDAGRVLAGIAASEKAADSIFQDEFRVRARTGEWLWILGRGSVVSRTADGQPRRMIGTLTDITRRKTAEVRLEALHEHTQLALKAGGIGTWELDVATGRFLWDDEMHAIYGLRPGAFGGSGGEWEASLHPDDRAEILANWRAVRQAGGRLGMDHRIVTPDGRIRHVRGVGQFEVGHDGRPARAFGINWDITAIKAAESGLAAARDAAEAADRAKSQFLAVMSHELRTPMTGVMGLADLVLVDDDLPERARERIEMLRQSAGTLLGLVDDILDFSKIEAGRLSLERIAFSPAAVVADVVALMTPAAGRRGNSIAVAPAALPQWVEGDPLRLRQVLYNIVGNAVKFTQSGDIRIDMSHEEEGAAIVLRFAVADSGIGMSQAQSERVFGTFTQADASTARRFGGTGLGLAISRRLVEAMGGAISVESEPGVGTTFRFSIGVTPAAAGPAVEQAAAPAPVGRPVRILLAEDNAVNRLLFGAMLRRMGHAVTDVETGLEAVQAVAGGGFDLLLTDVQMPDMDGPTAERAIRTLPGATGRIPIVGLSADVVPEHREQYLAAGFDAYLTKPVDWEGLSDTVSRLARPPQAADD